MMDNVFNDEEQLSMESLITLPVLDFQDEAQLLPEGFLQTSEDSCSGGGEGTDRNSGIDPNYGYDEGSFASVFSAYYPSMDASSFSALMKAQPTLDTEAEELIDCLQQPPPPFFCMEEQQEQLDHISSMTVAADEYSPDCMDPLLNVPPLPLPHPQQSHIQSVYDGDERFLSSIPSAAAAAPPTTAYLSMDSGLSGLYHEGIGHPLWGMGGGGREGKRFFTTDVVPMQFPDVEYQKMAVRGYNVQNSFQQYGYGSSDVQLLVDTPAQKQQNNSSLVVACSSPTALASDISSLDESTFKVGRLSAEEKKEKIHRYIKKRNERNFSKKIKYACRKTLADSRPRVRGRFAKNDEYRELTRTSVINHDYEDYDDEVLVKDEDSYEFSYM